jgi:hypothetical protein
VIVVAKKTSKQPASNGAPRSATAYFLSLSLENVQGQATIEILGLRREELTEQRRAHLRNLLLILDIRRLLRQRHEEGSLPIDEQGHLIRVEALVRELTRDDAPFAAMTRAVVASENSG